MRRQRAALGGEGYAAIKHMAFHQARVFASGEHAVFEATLDWMLNCRMESRR
ncbi:MAG: hypothetical protein JNM58_17960 [Xanthomonadaceae bacterium]|nr:hypothetical protein [Xanthomonadaceae bacterium]